MWKNVTFTVYLLSENLAKLTEWLDLLMIAGTLCFLKLRNSKEKEEKEKKKKALLKILIWISGVQLVSMTSAMQHNTSAKSIVSLPSIKDF